MNPDAPETIQALKAAISALTGQIAAQSETISLLKWALVAVSLALASVSGFFVAWIRSLYDERSTDSEAETKARDGLLERVLTAVSDLVAAQKAALKGREP